MKRNPRDLVRYNASERANHWVVGICFILLALSGLAFFHPAFFPSTR
jgi:formate dehydrogenase subunit gamma